MEPNKYIGKKINVLDDGHVTLVDYMGGDADIVAAARVSYGTGLKTPEEDTNLIRYLMRHKHTSPFEMVEFKFHLRLPIYVARQWWRHRTASINEFSQRYSEVKVQFNYNKDWRLQDYNNKQGSKGVLNKKESEGLERLEFDTLSTSQIAYELQLSKGVSREQARKVLPLSTYTEAYWKCNLHNIFHFLKLRMSSHAQLEIREYANALFECIKSVVPISCEAFVDYILDSQTFSKQEMSILEKLAELLSEHCSTLPKELGFSKREVIEFKEKLKLI